MQSLRVILSPDAAESKYVREEVNKALELGKTIFPILYRPGKWAGEFQALVSEIQTIDLRSGSYAENFQKLVDGLIDAGAGKATGERPFLRQSIKPPLRIVFSKIPGWALAWSLGWLVFWIVAAVFLLILTGTQGSSTSEDALGIILLVPSGMIGGFAGGLIAGLFTMLALRPNAPSISWRHMSPTIRIWGITGPLGMLISGLVTAFMVAIGAITVQDTDVDCTGLGFGECLGAGLRGAPWVRFSGGETRLSARLGVEGGRVRPGGWVELAPADLRAQFGGFTAEGKAEMVRELYDLNCVLHSLLVCDMPGKFVPLSMEDYANYLHAVTGESFSMNDFAEIAGRTETLIRLFNVREGFGRKDDTLAYRTVIEPLPDGPGKGQCIGAANLDRMIDEYYACRGWDSAGVPTEATLKKYDMAAHVAKG